MEATIEVMDEVTLILKETMEEAGRVLVKIVQVVAKKPPDKFFYPMPS